MADREQVIGDFLSRHGWATAERHPLGGDASFRRYERLIDGERRVMLMDAPPPHEDVRPFVRIAQHLSGLGLNAPEILAEDADAGLLIIEDFGDATYTRVLADGGDEEALYARAVDVLIALHVRTERDAVPSGLTRYGNGRLLDEAFLLPQWFVTAHTGEPLDEDARRAYGDAWLSLFPTVHAQPKTLVLRDYHVDNLMWLADRDGVAACGLLDFQDALAGAPAYDLMSLLEDARRDISGDLAAAMRARYHAAFPGRDAEAFDASYAILAAQRHAKVIGIFTRLKVRDGKGVYLNHIPRVWRLLERALENPILAPVRTWFDDHISADMRSVPPC